MKTVLCYGDSNTHGTVPLTRLGAFERYPRGSRWPDAMADALGSGVEVIAEGLPGRTSVHDDHVEGGKRNGLDVLPAILMSHVPLDLLVILLGTNDLKPRFAVSAFEIARSVERLALEARRYLPGLDILLVAPAPVAPAGVLAEAFEGALARQAELPRHLEEAAARQGCGFLDAGAHVAVSPVDGVHWTPEGHAIFSAAMASAVSARLRLSG